MFGWVLYTSLIILRICCGTFSVILFEMSPQLREYIFCWWSAFLGFYFRVRWKIVRLRNFFRPKFSGSNAGGRIVLSRYLFSNVQIPVKSQQWRHWNIFHCYKLAVERINTRLYFFSELGSKLSSFFGSSKTEEETVAENKEETKEERSEGKEKKEEQKEKETKEEKTEEKTKEKEEPKPKEEAKETKVHYSVLRVGVIVLNETSGQIRTGLRKFSVRSILFGIMNEKWIY